MTSKTFIVLDDDGNDLKYLGDWITSDRSGWYRGTAKFPPSSGNGRFNFTFEGTYVSFLGLQPSAASITLTDSSSTGNTTTTLRLPSASNRYVQWYRSPESTSRSYTITANELTSGSVDAILVGVDQKTPLTGKTLLVDDDDEEQISYVGKWTQNSKPFTGKLAASGWAVQNTTHETLNVGDLLIFRFTGTGLSIYGLFSWNNLSLLSLSFTLDNATVSRSYPVTPSSQEYLDQEGEVPNYLFFSYQNLRQGPHILVINVTDARDTSFRLDYLTYQPTFTDLSSKPVISADPVSPTDKTPTLGSDGTSFARSANVGAIVGGVVGGLFALSLVGLLLWLRRRRRLQSPPTGSVTVKMVTPFVDGTYEEPAEFRTPNTVTPFSPPSSTFNSPPSLPVDNAPRGKGAVIRPNPPVRGANSKALLLEQREVLNTPSSSSTNPMAPLSPTTPLSPKRQPQRSRTVSSSVSASVSSAFSPSVAPIPHTSKADLERAAAGNNQGPSPPSYNTIVPTRSKFSPPL